MAGLRASVWVSRTLGVLPRRVAGDGSQTRLLIVHLTPHLGDTVLLMPMIEALRKANPGARIEVAVEETAAPLLRRMPELDGVYALPLGQAPPVTAALAIQRSLRVVRAYWKQMRGAAPDVCLIPRWENDQYRSRVLAYLTGSPRRVGFAWDSVPGAFPARYRDGLLTEAVRGGSGLHEARRFCLLAHAAGLVPREAMEEDEHAVAALGRIAAHEDWPRLAERLGIDRTRPFAVIAPGATRAHRIWPTANWVQVCEALEAEGFEVVLLSGPSDKEIAERLYEERGRKGVLAAGVTNLMESTTLLAHASVFAGSESGPGHVAGALGVPTVVLFPTEESYDRDYPTSPRRIRPLGPLVKYCCQPRSLSPCAGTCIADAAHCIMLIEPEVVRSAVRSVLEGAEGPELASSRAGSLH
jgi:heptosyltransferase I